MPSSKSHDITSLSYVLQNKISRFLAVIVWISSMLFGLYILSFYFLSLLNGNTAQWNEVLPGLYDKNTTGATLGIGIHFAAGGLILVLGSIQLISHLRIKFPVFHRWIGRTYVLASMLTAIGGITFIIIKGTIGGVIMDLAFMGYGILTFLSAFETIRYARKREIEKHRAWALRLYALAIGSWLYRMDYGFWFLFMDGIGHTKDFTGPFDYFMGFFFYLPNLLVAEFFIRRKKLRTNILVRWMIILGLISVSLFLILATYYFTRHLWGPSILKLF